MTIQDTDFYVAEMIKIEMRLADISGASLAKKIGRSQDFLAKRLRNEASFTIKDIEHIAAALNTTAHNIMSKVWFMFDTQVDTSDFKQTLQLLTEFENVVLKNVNDQKHDFNSMKLINKKGTITPQDKANPYKSLDPNKLTKDQIAMLKKENNDYSFMYLNHHSQSKNEIDTEELSRQLKDPSMNFDDLYDEINNTPLQDTYGLAAREDKTGQKQHYDNNIVFDDSDHIED